VPAKTSRKGRLAPIEAADQKKRLHPARSCSSRPEGRFCSRKGISSKPFESKTPSRWPVCSVCSPAGIDTEDQRPADFNVRLPAPGSRPAPAPTTPDLRTSFPQTATIWEENMCQTLRAPPPFRPFVWDLSYSSFVFWVNVLRSLFATAAPSSRRTIARSKLQQPTLSEGFRPLEHGVSDELVLFQVLQEGEVGSHVFDHPVDRGPF